MTRKTITTTARAVRKAAQRRKDATAVVAWWAGCAGRGVATLIWIVLLALVLIFEFFRGLIEGLIAEWRIQRRMRKEHKARKAEADRWQSLTTRRLLPPPDEILPSTGALRTSGRGGRGVCARCSGRSAAPCPTAQ